MKKKLNFDDLKVESFETTLEDKSLKAVAGGSVTHSGCWPSQGGCPWTRVQCA